jgi:hypothetical protein
MLLRLTNPPGAYGSGQPSQLNLVGENFSLARAATDGGSDDQRCRPRRQCAAPGVISLMSRLPAATLNGVPYESMGFRTVETWTYLMTQPA